MKPLPEINDIGELDSIFLRVVSSEIEMTAWIDETMFIMFCPYSHTDAALNSQRIQNMIRFIANGRSKSHLMNDPSLDGYSLQYRKIEPLGSCELPVNVDRFIYVLDKTLGCKMDEIVKYWNQGKTRPENKFQTQIESAVDNTVEFNDSYIEGLTTDVKNEGKRFSIIQVLKMFKTKKLKP